MAVPAHPYPPDTRVHFAAEPTPVAYEKGTATVLSAMPKADGSFTYHVKRDSGGEAEWASYFTIPVRLTVADPAMASYEPPAVPYEAAAASYDTGYPGHAARSYA